MTVRTSLLIVPLCLTLSSLALAAEDPETSQAEDSPAEDSADEVEVVTLDQLQAALDAAEAAKQAADEARELAERALASAEAAVAKTDEVEVETKRRFDLLDYVKLHGTYQVWGLNQRNFLLGADHPLDDANYVVQMLRGKLKIGSTDYGVNARFDAAQGWWGVDNSPDDGIGITTAEDGTVSATRSYNPYSLFREKDTNYTLHFDHAYAYVKLPKIPVTVRAGRQPFKLGHRLVLDADLDGVQVDIDPIDQLDIQLFWAAMSEGLGSYKVPFGGLMSDKGASRDANVFGGVITAYLDPVRLAVHGAGLIDNSGDGAATFLPGGVGYFNSRFRPNLSKVGVVGITLDGDLDVLAGFHLEAEFDYLFGKDEVDNTDHAGGLLDVNDGTINGYTFYLRADQKVQVKKVGVHFGAAFGLGSGDDDPTSGRGNVTKIQTAGLFPWTNVWEDSVMPDIGGISPQGLGSPVSRGYREFENTTTVLVHAGLTPVPPLTFDVAYAWMGATQPIFGFDETGTPTTASSKQIGHEIDVNGSWKVWKQVTYKLLFGYFIPGEGSGLLINGSTDSLVSAWEVKQVLAVGF